MQYGTQESEQAYRWTTSNDHLVLGFMNIRLVEKSDNLHLAKVIRKAFDEHNAPKQGTVYSDPTTDNLYALFQKKRSALWVAEIDAAIVGCCGIYPTNGLPENCVELVKFYLAKQSRGKGIGKELLERSIESAKEFGYTALYLESLPEFSKAVQLYEKLGFIRLNKPLGSSGHTSCNIWMIKTLKND